MLFNSAAFLFWFLPAVLAGYYASPARWRLLVLLVASYIFYGAWNPFFCGLMLLSTIIDYIAGLQIAATQNIHRKRLFLILSLGANLSLLGFFKYYGMFSETLNALSGSSFMPLLAITLPIGISFYTFQSMSYSIEIYQGISRPANNFVSFACYVSLFPQLIAGPIVRYSDIASQLITRAHSYAQAAEGVYRFVIGLTKKVIIADAMATVADNAFGAEMLTGSQAWLGILAYSFQIYYDFSGYSDMAIGLGMLFGFRFPENFRMPYHSKSMTEFWQRWHITMSSWFRDYLYIPLGGNQHGKMFTLRNLLITMFLAGLWHGAAWTFVVWGLYHGVLLMLERMTGKKVGVVPTFLLVMVGWVLFRASSFEHALAYYRALLGGFNGTVDGIAIGIVVIGLLVTLLEPFLPAAPKKYSAELAIALALLLLLCIAVIFGNTASPFIYFQF